MYAWIEPDVDRAGEMFLLAIAKADDEKLAGMRNEVTHGQKYVAALPNALGADDYGHGAVGPAHEDALPFFDDVKEHGGTSEGTGVVFAVTGGHAGGGRGKCAQSGSGGPAPTNGALDRLVDFITEAQLFDAHRRIGEFLQHRIDRFHAVAVMMRHGGATLGSWEWGE